MDQRQHAEPGHRHLADLQIVGILDDAVHRRAHVGALEVEPAPCRPRPGPGAICGCSPGAIAAWALAARARASASSLLGGLHLVERILIVGAGREALLQQRLLARQAHCA